MDELLEQFLIEGPELVQQAAADLLELERRPDDLALVDSAFRAIHTLKGSVGLFDMVPVGRILHAAEDSLDAVRQGRLAVTSDLIDALLAIVDRTEAWLEASRGGAGLEAGADEDADRLTRRLSGAAPEAATASSTPARSQDWALDLVADWPEAAGAASAVRYTPDVQAYFRGDDPLAIARAAPGLLALRVTAPSDAAEADYDPFACRLRIDLLSTASAEVLGDAFRLVRDQTEVASLSVAAAAPIRAEAAPASATLRIDARRIDALSTLADELVVAKNGLMSLADPTGDLAAARQTIDRLANALHGDIMRLRLVALSPVLRRLERQARDLATELGKPIDLQVRGHGVEVDKAVADAVYEPLLHLLRNALDHGAETAAERAAAGKSARTRVSVTARTAGDEVEIEVADDGRGIDPRALIATARARGLGARIDLDGLAEAAALELIFAPGFSTAESVTAVSGRGVGMDVVRTSVGVLGGRVGIASEPGHGTRTTVRLPLTVVMTRILLVESGGETFGVPMADVHETLRIEAANIQPVRVGQAIVLRDAVLPYLPLAGLVGAASAATAGATVLVVETAAGRVALGVDRITNRLDVVLRPVAGLLARIPGALGTTLLGDGRLLVVLDVEAITA